MPQIEKMLSSLKYGFYKYSPIIIPILFTAYGLSVAQNISGADISKEIEAIVFGFTFGTGAGTGIYFSKYIPIIAKKYDKKYTEIEGVYIISDYDNSTIKNMSKDNKFVLAARNPSNLEKIIFYDKSFKEVNGIYGIDYEKLKEMIKISDDINGRSTIDRRYVDLNQLLENYSAFPVVFIRDNKALGYGVVTKNPYELYDKEEKTKNLKEFLNKYWL